MSSSAPAIGDCRDSKCVNLLTSRIHHHFYVVDISQNERDDVRTR